MQSVSWHVCYECARKEKEENVSTFIFIFIFFTFKGFIKRLHSLLKRMWILDKLFLF